MNSRREARAVKQDDERGIRSVLASINWNFSTPFSVGRSGLQLFDARKHHWYPATFIPEIPYTLIELLSREHSKIYDPFAGIGTSIFQALRLGRIPFGNEICRVAVDVIHSTWTLLSPNIDLNRAAVKLEAIMTEAETTQIRPKDAIAINPTFELLRPWYNQTTFKQLSYLFVEQTRCKDTAVKATLRVAISACLKAVCAQDKGWGCIADNVLPSKEQLARNRDAVGRTKRNAMLLLKSATAFRKQLPTRSLSLIAESKPSDYVQHADIRQKPAPAHHTIELIVTSPPYPSMTDYATSQRLSYYWLGSDPSDDMKHEIGARRRRFASSAIDQYKEGMRSVVDALHSTVVSGASVCFVLPTFTADRENNIIRRRVIQDVLAYVGEHGFLLEQELDRILPERRRHHNQGWTSLERERIYFFRSV